MAIACGQIAAALVTGNAVVFKPSEKTPLTGGRIVELLDIPGEVLQLVHGDARSGRPLARHECVDLVVHTGSVRTGREVARACAGRLGKALLELGGKDALIVDAGVDPEWAADQAALGAFANAGQICTSVERIYVHEEVAEPFLSALARRAQTLRVGSGMDPDSEMGPLIDDEQRMWVHRHVRDAISDGAELLAGGELPDGPGFFYPPTVIAGPSRDAPVLREETFGPVAAVRTVPRFERALEEARPARRPGRDRAHAVAGQCPARLARAAGREREGQRRLRRRPGRRPRAARRDDPREGRTSRAVSGTDSGLVRVIPNGILRAAARW